uniref:Ribonuclease VapC n=1 Tax=Archaeoglobus fulgidus TaxID=2234 RepID=A0A7J2TLP8_ARCFL
METDRIRRNRLIFDTNALIYAVKNKIDLSHFDILLPRAVINELLELEKKLSGNDRIAVKIALKVAENAEIVESKKGDEGIIEIAKNLGLCLITNDKELRKRAQKLGIQTGYVKLGKIVFS